MIKIRVRLNSQGELVEVTSMGHAEKSKPLCTAVSTLEYQLLYSIEALVVEVEVSPKINTGSFQLSIKKNSHQESLEKQSVLQILSHSFVIGIKMLVEKYPTEIKFVVVNE